MTDDENATQAPPSTEPANPATVNPGAQAARRARRIGGRAAAPAAGSPASAPPAAASRPSDPSGRGARPSVTGTVPLAKPPAQPAASGQPVPPAWLNWLPAAVLSAGALLMAVLLVVLSHGVWWGPDPSRTPGGATTLREQVLAAAKTCTAATNSYKYTDLDTFERKGLACSTGQFATEFKKYLDTVLRVDAARLKASQTAQINRGGIEAITADGGQWTLLLYGQLSVTNTSYPKGRVDPFAAQVRMERHKGQWVIVGLTTVSPPGA